MTVIAYALIDKEGNVLNISQKESYVKTKQRNEFPDAEIVELVRMNRQIPTFKNNEEIMFSTQPYHGILRNEAQLSLFTTNEEGVDAQA